MFVSAQKAVQENIFGRIRDHRELLKIDDRDLSIYKFFPDDNYRTSFPAIVVQCQQVENENFSNVYNQVMIECRISVCDVLSMNDGKVEDSIERIELLSDKIKNYLDGVPNLGLIDYYVFHRSWIWSMDQIILDDQDRVGRRDLILEIPLLVKNGENLRT